MPLTVTRVARSFADLSSDGWAIIAMKPYTNAGPLRWEFTMDQASVGAYRRALGAGAAVTVTQREPDGTLTLFAKLATVRRRAA